VPTTVAGEDDADRKTDVVDCADSPVIQSKTVVPDASAIGATVDACEQRTRAQVLP
jgi:hypothetical protein